MNKAIIIGNLTRDPELRATAEGVSVCNLIVAVNRKTNKDHPEADYFRVTVWRQLADLCAKYLAKGRKVCVTGPVSASAYMDKQTGDARASLEITASEVEFLTPKGQPGSQQGEYVDENGFRQVDDEDLPY